MDRSELSARVVEKSMNHSDHTNAEEDRRQEGDLQESVVD